MTREEAKNIVKGITDKIEATTDIDDWAEFWGFTREDYEDFLEMSIKALEQEPCEDCISRQAAIDALTKTSGIRGDALKALYDLPSVTQQPKTGHWIFDEILDKHYYCSECKSMGVDYWDYCPNCGCRMVEPQESEE